MTWCRGCCPAGATACPHPLPPPGIPGQSSAGGSSSRGPCTTAHLRKTAFLSHLYIKTIILPRQARDKHRENSKKDAVFRTALAAAGRDETPGELLADEPLAIGNSHDLPVALQQVVQPVGGRGVLARPFGALARFLLPRCGFTHLRKTPLFFGCFPYVYPEPALAKCSFLYINGAKSGGFTHPSLGDLRQLAGCGCARHLHREAAELAHPLRENGTFLSGFPMFVPSLSW
eukprot:COSAG06_NODE_11271_length_1534_cov_49.620209_1_plen_231_part_00